MSGLDWTKRGACGDADASLFHPIGERWSAGREEAAKLVCARCPVTEACLKFGRESGDAWGVYGGLTAEERRGKALRPATRRDPNRCAQGAHLLDDDNLGIDNLGHRFCKACKRARSAAAYKAKAEAKAAQLQAVSA